MKMSLVVDGLRSDAVAVGELGDDTVAMVAERIADVLGRVVPGRMLDLLSEAAAELTATLPDGHVDIRVAGDDVELTYVEDEPGPMGEGDDLSARITLRLSDGLKARLEQGAAADGVSVNSFILRTLERGTSSNRSRNGRAGTACAATARPEGSSGHGEGIRDPGRRRLHVENAVGLVVDHRSATETTDRVARGGHARHRGAHRAGHRRVPAGGGPTMSWS